MIVSPSVAQPGCWDCGLTPPNVRLGSNTLVTGDLAFKRFHATAADALVIGDNCTMEGVHFAVGERGNARVGDFCYFTYVVLLCEMTIQIGSYVVIGWNTTIADSDFHPLAPAERIADAIACSPLGKGRPRPALVKSTVVIEDNVWIGPSVTILKGVRIGLGAFIEAGSLITRDVPSRARVLGNPAQIIGEMP